MLSTHNLGIMKAGRWLMREATLTLPTGQLIALVGPNGAGKSTLLRLLAGIWQPTVGQVTLNHQNLQHFSRTTLAKHLTFLPQQTVIEFAFTVQDLVRMGRYPYLTPSQFEREEDKSQVIAAMKSTDVLPLASRLITELSGGERQRVFIARSLATQANILLLDEPTANLDIAHALELLELLVKLCQQGKTIILALHDLNAAIRYANQVILIQQGRIISLGSPEQVLTAENILAVFGVQAAEATGPKGEKLWWFHGLGSDLTTF